MSNPEDPDEIAELADRLVAKSRRDDPEAVFEVEWGALTDDERREFPALMQQRLAHGQEQVEALGENVAALKALLCLQVARAPGLTLREAIGGGHIGFLEVIEAIRGAMLADRLA